MNIGDWVSTVTGSHRGEVVEIDDGQVYLKQKNGVEIDFPASMLVKDQPKVAPTMQDFNETECLRLLKLLPPEIVLAAEIMYNRVPNVWRPLSFAELPAMTRLKVVDFLFQQVDRLAADETHPDNQVV